MDAAKGVDQASGEFWSRVETLFKQRCQGREWAEGLGPARSRNAIQRAWASCRTLCCKYHQCYRKVEDAKLTGNISADVIQKATLALYNGLIAERNIATASRNPDLRAGSPFNYIHAYVELEKRGFFSLLTNSGVAKPNTSNQVSATGINLRPQGRDRAKAAKRNAVSIDTTTSSAIGELVTAFKQSSETMNQIAQQGRLTERIEETERLLRIFDKDEQFQALLKTRLKADIIKSFAAEKEATSGTQEDRESGLAAGRTNDNQHSGPAPGRANDASTTELESTTAPTPSTTVDVDVDVDVQVVDEAYERQEESGGTDPVAEGTSEAAGNPGGVMGRRMDDWKNNQSFHPYSQPPPIHNQAHRRTLTERRHLVNAPEASSSRPFPPSLHHAFHAPPDCNDLFFASISSNQNVLAIPTGSFDDGLGDPFENMGEPLNQVTADEDDHVLSFPEVRYLQYNNGFCNKNISYSRIQ